MKNEIMPSWFHTVFPINSLPAIQLSGVGIDQLSHSAEIKIRAAVQYYQAVPADLLFFFSDIAIQAEAMGATVIFGPDFMPSVTSPASQIACPNPRHIKRMCINAKVIKSLSSEFPHQYRAAMVYGPFTVAGQLAGEQRLLKDTQEQPSVVHSILKKTLTFAKDYAELLFDAGADFLWVSDPLSALLPPQAFWEFAGVYLAGLFSMKTDKKTALHICGETTHIIKDMVTTGVGGISFDQCMDLMAIADDLPPDVALIGNLDPVAVLEQKSPQEVVVDTTELTDAIGTMPNFVLSTGCAPPPSAPVANVVSFVITGKERLKSLLPYATQLQDIAHQTLAGHRHETVFQVEEAIKSQIPPLIIVNSGLMTAVKKASALYENNRMYLPAVLLMVDAFYDGFSKLEPLINSYSGSVQVVLGTVAGDIHEIGKNLVRIMLEANGIRVQDLGVNVQPSSFINACIKCGAKVVGLSVFITSARPQLEEVMTLIQQSDLKNMSVIIGGAAASQKVAEKIGSHGYAKDAMAAVKLVHQLLKCAQ